MAYPGRWATPALGLHAELARLIVGLSADPQCPNYRGRTCSSTVRRSPTGDPPDSSTPSYSEDTCRRAGLSKSLALCRRRQGTCRVQPTDVQTCTQSRVWHQSMALVGSGAYEGAIIVLSRHLALGLFCVHCLVRVVAFRSLALHARLTLASGTADRGSQNW